MSKLKGVAVLGIVSFVFLAGRGGSTVSGVTVSPSSPAVVVSGVSFEPAADIHGWWNVGPTEPGVWSLAVDRAGSGTLYVATVGGGVRKSIDYGQTWTSVDSGLSSMDVFERSTT